MSSNPTLISKALGPLPLINRFLERLKIEHLFDKYVPRRDRRQKISPAIGLGVLLRNILVAREPLYGLSAWAQKFEESMLGIPLGETHLLNDDRSGRNLDDLFVADRAAFLTELVVHAVREFDIAMDELHNDSTTITFTGQYVAATGENSHGKPTHRITHGHNKDHRPDLKQLIWILTTSADGTVPIWCSVDHGNSTDDKTHIETWNTLCRVVGTPDFLYVADSKLCTKENMAHIAQRQGRFITVLPKTRREDSWFRDWLQEHDPGWLEIIRRKSSRRKSAPDEVYRGCESSMASVEGYRICWYWSSQKHELDRSIRQERIQKAIDGLEDLRASLNSPKSRMRTQARIEAKARSVLIKAKADRWIIVTVQSVEEHQYRQETAGRPNENTRYVRRSNDRFILEWKSNAETLQYDDKTDGIFPLVLNDKNLSLQDALLAYKRQPSLEKRHEQMKTVLEVMPVNLKSHRRIEALFLLYFIALLVESLMEREIRKNMKTMNIVSIPLYHEGRPCKAPTAQRVIEEFQDVRRHLLMGDDKTVKNIFCDELTKLQKTILIILNYSHASYFNTPRITTI